MSQKNFKEVSFRQKHKFSQEQYNLKRKEFKKLIDELRLMINTPYFDRFKALQINIALKNINDCYIFLTNNSISMTSIGHTEKYHQYINNIEEIFKSRFFSVFNGKGDLIIQKFTIIKSIYEQQFEYVKEIESTYSDVVSKYKWKVER